MWIYKLVKNLFERGRMPPYGGWECERWILEIRKSKMGIRKSKMGDEKVMF